MARLIRDGAVTEDAWKLLRLAEGERAEDLRLPVGPLLVPVAVWRARARELVERQYEFGDPLGVWLAGDEGPEAIAGDIDDFSVIGVEFARPGDGRGYSTARLLRDRYGFRGELRAVGAVMRDQLFYLRRVGFNAFAVRPDKNIELALGGLLDFSAAYQGSADSARTPRGPALRPAA